MQKVLISGGSGLVGQALTNQLIQEGFEVGWLSRSKREVKSVKTFLWDIDKMELEPESLEWCDAVVHLAGAGIADKRWTDHRKKVILESRVKSTELLRVGIEKASSKPEVFVGASAIGYYGADTGEQWVSEETEPGNDFLAEVVTQWEDAVDEIQQLGLRVVKNRIGIVLSDEGGALEPLKRTTKFGLAAPIGSGKQYMSWIHIQDLVEIFIQSLKNHDYSGVCNCVAPNPVTNKEFSKTLARVMKKPFFLPNVPKFVLQLMFGEMAVIITGGNKVKSNCLEKRKFQFSFSKLEEALLELVKAS